MKALITYTSETGNTAKLANEIYKSYQGDNVICEMSNLQNFNNYDLIFIGFQMHQFKPAKAAIDFMRELDENQKVVLFATHAMLPDLPMNSKQLENCKKYTEHLDLLGIFSCVGELAESVADSLINSGNKQLESFGKMRDQTVGHPDENDINELKKFINEITN